MCLLTISGKKKYMMNKIKNYKLMLILMIMSLIFISSKEQILNVGQQMKL